MRQPFCPCAFLKPLTMIRSHIGRVKRRCQFRRRRCPIQRCRSSICEFNNPKGRLLPGMFAYVALDLPMGEQTVIPDTAVLRTGTHNVAFIDRGDGYLTPAEVELGMHVDDEFIMLKGLAPGQQIVSSANFLIDSESQLQAAAGAFVPPPPGVGANAAGQAV